MSAVGGTTSLVLAAAAAVLVPTEHVTLANRQVRLGDVATIRGVDGVARQALERRVLAELPVGQPRAVLSRTAVSSLIRRAVPGLPVTGTADGSIVFAAPAPAIRRGASPPAPEAQVTGGTVLTLVSLVGPVSVQRSVTTLQPARPGHRVFVRDEDGNVFPSRLAADAAQ